MLSLLFKCEECEYVTNKKYNLTRHENAKYNIIKEPKQEKEENVMSKEENVMSKEENVMSKEENVMSKEENYYCKKCNKKYKTKNIYLITKKNVMV